MHIFLRKCKDMRSFHGRLRQPAVKQKVPGGRVCFHAKKPGRRIGIQCLELGWLASELPQSPEVYHSMN